MSHANDRPAAAGGQALKLSADDVLQHLLVERQVGNDPLQTPVLLFELPQSLHFRGKEARALAKLRTIKGGNEALESEH
jgi:hypothetical protein